jgi:signal transduction histidine kinase
MSVSLLLYAHIPAALLALFFGIFILHKTKNKTGVTFFVVCASFAIWCFLDLCTWFAFNSAVTMFTWSFFGLFELIMFFFSYYFLYTFVAGHDLPIWQKVTGLLLLLPTAIWIFMGSILTLYNSNDCTAVENDLITRYPYFVEAFLIIAVLLFILIQYKRAKDSVLKKKILFTGSGVAIFLILFFSSNFLVYLLASSDASAYVYNYEIYGLFGMPILLAFLVYTVVRFKAFNIKLLGAQALVWALIILIGSECFFVTNLISQILVGVTLILSSLAGYLIVRSMKKEIAQKEHIEKIAKELEIANAGQKNLIHIINHQIKGYLGVAKNIFAELWEGQTYGKMPEEAQPLLAKGLEDMSKGVDYVQGILTSESAQSGTLTFNMKPMDLKPVVLNLVSKQKEIAEKNGLSFESNFADGNYNIIGDAIQLEEALKNLITNAIKYNNPKGTIVVTLSNTNKKIILSVKDTGRGISKDDEKRLYKPGGMGKDSMKYNVEASGYGLAFVKPVIEMHKGRVWYNTEVGKGTTFFVELPPSSKNIIS